MDRKLSIEEFNNYKARLEKIISDFSEQTDNLSREEKLELQKKCIDEYVKLEEELFSCDLSGIPFELFENMTLMARDGEVLDLSKSRANIDFNYVRVFGDINFKGCKIKNVKGVMGFVNPKYLDSSVVEENKDYFLSDDFPEEFRYKWYRDQVSLDDVSKLSVELISKLTIRKELNSHLRSEAYCIRYLGLKTVVNLYKYSLHEYEDIKMLINLIRNTEAIKKIDLTITNPQYLIDNIYQIVREELMHPSNVYMPINLEISNGEYRIFPAKLP